MVRVSIVVVNYHSSQHLLACLRSIRTAKISLEVIVVDNDENPTLSSILPRRFPAVRYLHSPGGNIGYSAANNLGSTHSQGEYLFFLNPDTLLLPGCLETLADFLDRHPQAGVVAPLLLTPRHQPYPLQGSRQLTPLSATFALTFINRLFPQNPVSRHYWLADWDKKSLIAVDVVPGTAFLIRSRLFRLVGGFDPGFFLYFEESDLCRRVASLGRKIFINTAAKLVHFWAKSTPASLSISRIFTASRFRYFSKHFGGLQAIWVELVCRLSQRTIILPLALLAALFLRFYRLTDQQMFIGDQAWFFLSARNALFSGQLPLLGITASITWLHQGPLWTYLLVPLLALFDFHPAAPAFLTSFLGVLAVPLAYLLAKKIAGRKMALTASFLLATLPFFVIHSRLAYDTSPIPLFALVFFLCLATGRFFLAGLFMGFLYQLHLLTFIYWPVLAWWVIKTKASLLPALLGLLLGIIPFIASGPVQTAGIFIWLGRQVLSGFRGTGLLSEAYLVVLSVPALLLLSGFLAKLPSKLLMPPLVLLGAFNAFQLLSQNFYLDSGRRYGPSLNTRLHLSRQILAESYTTSPQLSISGPGSRFPTSVLPYTYLVWWLSRSAPPSGIHSSFLINGAVPSFSVLE